MAHLGIPSRGLQALLRRMKSRGVRAALRRMNLPRTGLIVDVGGSDGSVLADLRRRGEIPKRWLVGGYDLRVRHVEAARRRELRHLRLHRVDLDDATAREGEPADVVLCVGTLEQVGDYASALDLLHASLRPGGRLVLSLSNQVGIVGLVKLLGLLLRHPTQAARFFRGRRHVLRYAGSVLTYRDLKAFRQPPRQEWDPHFGFDHRAVTAHIKSNFVDNGRWTIECIDVTSTRAYRLLTIRRDEPTLAPEGTFRPRRQPVSLLPSLRARSYRRPAG